jgi:hypothetical protein
MTSSRADWRLFSSGHSSAKNTSFDILVSDRISS